MANPIQYPLSYALGNSKAQGFTRVQYAKITEMIDSINKITAGTITLTDVELGDGTVALPALTFANDLNTGIDRKSTRLNSSHIQKSRMPSSA